MIRTITAIALAASVAVTPAFAASDKFDMEIDYNTAQLKTLEGATEEYSRIKGEVHQRCLDEHAQYDFGQDYVVTICERKMMKKIVASLDNENFTQAHFAQK